MSGGLRTARKEHHKPKPKPACVLRSERNPKPIEEMYLPVRGHGRLVAPAVMLRWPLFQEQ
jgi:hypothetical protein